MAESALHLMSLDAVVEEAGALRCSTTASQIDRWADLGMLPSVQDAGRRRFPLTALPLLCELVRASSEPATIQRRADAYNAAAAGLAPAYDHAFDELRVHIGEHAVLGELHRMLPVLEPDALATLRGEARLEWRMRQALRELSHRITGSEREAVRSAPEAPLPEPPVAAPSEQLASRVPLASAPSAESALQPTGRRSMDADDPFATQSMATPAALPAVYHAEPDDADEPAIDRSIAHLTDSVETLPSPARVAAEPASGRPAAATGAAAIPPAASPPPNESEAPALQQEFSALRAAVENARRRMATESGTASAKNPGEEMRDARRSATSSTGVPVVESTGVFPAASIDVAPDGLDAGELPKVPALHQHGGDEREERDERRPGSSPRYQSPTTARRPDEPTNRYRAVRSESSDADAPDVSQRTTEMLERTMRKQPAMSQGTPRADRETVDTRSAGSARSAETLSAEVLETAGHRAAPGSRTVFEEEFTREEFTRELEVFGDESAASAEPDPPGVEQLIEQLGSNDREAAYRAWNEVAALLRDGDDPGRLLGALLLMAEREPVPAAAEAFLVEASEVASERLSDTRQALDILAGIVRRNPHHDGAFERAAALAEAYGLWAPWYETLESVVLTSTDIPSLAPVVVAAATIADERLSDPKRAEKLYEKLVESGAMEPAAARFLSQRYRDRGDYRRALELMLTLAEVAPGAADDSALRSAAEVVASDLGSSDKTLDLYEQALLMTGAGDGLRSDYVRQARQHAAAERGIDFLAGSTRSDDPVDQALEKARIALDEFDAPELAIAALQAALPDVGTRRIEVVRELVRIELRRGDAGRAASNVEHMLARAEEPATRAELTLLMDEVQEHNGASADARAERLSIAVEQGIDDVRVVERLGALWAEGGRWEASLDLFALAADRSVERPEEQREWLRRAAWVAADRIEGDDAAIGFLEEAVTASSGDAEVLYALAIRCRKSRDRLSEMAALERIVAQGDIHALPSLEVARLAELQVARPRGAARSAELLEMLLEVDELDAETGEAVGRLLPQIAESSGRHDLHLRWLEREVGKAQTTSEALVLWKLIVELQERAELPEGERVQAVEEALRCAEQLNVPDNERAPLHLRAARARAALAQWEPALAHAMRASELFVLTGRGSTQTFRALTVLERVARDVRDDRAAFAMLHRGAEQGGVRERLLLARASVRTERWDDAIPVLESLVSREAELTEEELAEVREDLARAYRRAPRS